MKVLALWQSVFPWEVRVEKIAESLLAAGHSVTLLSRKKDGAPERERLASGLEVVRVGTHLAGRWSTPISFNPVWARAIEAEIRREKPDLVIARDIPLAEAAGRAARRHGIPVIMDMAEHYPGAMRSWKKHQENPVSRLAVHGLKIPDWVERRAVARMDGILTVCDEQIDRLAEAYGFPRERMIVVNNSPKQAWFAEARKGPGERPRVFGHHGHMTPERGLDCLLDAFYEVQKEFADVELQLAGAGESAAEVSRRVAELGIAGKVKLIGRYAHADLDRLYGDIDVGVLPYPPNELINHTLSNKIFDYMACGKPVITSSAAPMKRLVTKTGAGLVFGEWEPRTLAASMRRMLQSTPEALKRMSENGMRALRDEYYWERDVERMLRFVVGLRA